MMMEQQTILKNDEFQERWRKSIRVTCCLYRATEAVKDCVHKLMEALRNFFNSLGKAFKRFKITISEFKDRPQKQTFSKIYPHKYPHYVDKCKYNSKGFQRPIMRCARSRC